MAARTHTLCRRARETRAGEGIARGEKACNKQYQLLPIRIRIEARRLLAPLVLAP